jgi:hypothetical protein
MHSLIDIERVSQSHSSHNMCYEERKEQTPIHIMKFMCFLILQKIYLNNESIFKMVPNVGS